MTEECPVCHGTYEDLWEHFALDLEGCGSRMLELGRREAALMRTYGRH
jgi:hypothetical protein